MTGCEHEVFRDVPWPFAQGEFPPELGAVIQRTVLDGELPACVVIHDSGNSWLVGDGINDPNVKGAVAVACMKHAVELNPAVAELTTLPAGWEAVREGPGGSWERHPHRYADEE